MSERNTLRSFCKLAAVPNGAYVDMDFRDTAGSIINCNWFRVDCSAAPVADVAYYVVQPSSLSGHGGENVDQMYQQGISSISVIAAASAGPTKRDHTSSGIGGLIGIPGRDPVEMNVRSRDRRAVRGVRIWNLTNSHPHALFTLTYGNVKHANRLKDNDDIFWPPGA